MNVRCLKTPSSYSRYDHRSDHPHLCLRWPAELNFVTRSQPYDTKLPATGPSIPSNRGYHVHRTPIR